MNHFDTVIIEVRGLELEFNGLESEYGYFIVHPRNLRGLNSQRRLAAQRIYGPDEENFGRNMVMLAAAGKTPYVFVLRPNYVQAALQKNRKKFVGRGSSLASFNNGSDFNAYGNDNVNYHYVLRGVRLNVASDAAQSPVPSTPQEIAAPTVEQVLACLGDDVASSVKPNIEGRIRKLYKR